MVDPKVIKAQIKATHTDLPFWVKPEARELPHIIVEGEVIKHLVSGRYEGGFALLVATDQRLLIVDKKPLFLAVEDMRYDMVSEINYSHRLMDSILHANSFSKEVWFNSYNKPHLREATTYVQQRISEIRYQQNTSTNSQPITPMLVDDGQITQEQARGLLPVNNTTWSKVHYKMNTNNTYPTNPTFVRRRVSKFYTS